MFLDMHIHESTCSSDSRMTLAEIVETAKARGLDGVCVTDHDSMGLREQAEAYSREIGFPFLWVWSTIPSGVTLLHLESMLFPVPASPPRTLSARSVRQAASVWPAISFRSNNRGLKEHLRDVRGLHGVEVLNGSTDLAANRLALARCRELGLTAIGASDAHWTSQIGVYATYVPGHPRTISELVQALHQGGVHPAILENGGYRIADTL